MRSRYTAFVKAQPKYLMQAVAGTASQQEVHIDPHIRWTRLVIHHVTAGGIEDTTGEVQFTAYFIQKNGLNSENRQMHEHSIFEKINGHWFYVGRQ